MSPAEFHGSDVRHHQCSILRPYTPALYQFRQKATYTLRPRWLQSLRTRYPFEHSSSVTIGPLPSIPLLSHSLLLRPERNWSFQPAQNNTVPCQKRADSDWNVPFWSGKTSLLHMIRKYRGDPTYHKAWFYETHLNVSIQSRPQRLRATALHRQMRLLKAPSWNRVNIRDAIYGLHQPRPLGLVSFAKSWM